MAASSSNGGGPLVGVSRGASRGGERADLHGGRAGRLPAVRSRLWRQESREINSVLRFTPFVTAGSRRRRVLALTFDDGPSPYTPEIVRILVRMHAPATFFVVGQQLGVFPAAFRDELAHGFVIGDHTENHAWLVRLSAAGQSAQIRGAAAGIDRP